VPGFWRRLLGGTDRDSKQETPEARRDDGDEKDGEDEEDLGETVDLPLTDVLDLHSFPPRDVPDLVREYLDAAHAAGFRKLRIVHGKGRGVQREIVRKILAADPRVRSFGDPPGEAGGWGATWVELG